VKRKLKRTLEENLKALEKKIEETMKTYENIRR